MTSPTDIERLDAFLSHPDRPGGTLSLMELRGLLFALQGAPRLVPPSEMLQLVFGGELAGFDTIEEAEEILPAIIGLGNEINQSILDRAPELPEVCTILDDPMSNFDPASPLAQWSRGFEMGYLHVEEDWAQWVLDVEDDSDRALAELSHAVGAALMVLTLFASREKAEGFRHVFVEDGTSLERVAKQTVQLFTEAMRTYGNVGRSIYEAVLEVEREQARARDAHRAVGRNAPCPCGSGRKFKKCCGKGLR